MHEPPLISVDIASAIDEIAGLAEVQLMSLCLNLTARARMCVRLESKQNGPSTFCMIGCRSDPCILTMLALENRSSGTATLPKIEQVWLGVLESMLSPTIFPDAPGGLVST